MRFEARALALLLTPLLAVSARGGDGSPGLSHSAPFLGRTLTLEVQGAPPLQARSLPWARRMRTAPSRRSCPSRQMRRWRKSSVTIRPS